MVVAYLKALSWHLPGKIEVTQRTSKRTSGSSIEIWTRYFVNTSLSCYLYTSLTGKDYVMWNFCSAWYMNIHLFLYLKLKAFVIIIEIHNCSKCLKSLWKNKDHGSMSICYICRVICENQPCSIIKYVLHVSLIDHSLTLTDFVLVTIKSQISSLVVIHSTSTILCLSKSVSIWHSSGVSCRCRICLSSRSLPRSLLSQIQSSDSCHPGTEGAHLNHLHRNLSVPSRTQRRTCFLWCGSQHTLFCRHDWQLSAPSNWTHIGMEIISC